MPSISAVPGPAPGAEHSGYPCRRQLVALSTSGAILKALSLFPLKVCALAQARVLPMGFGRLCPWGWLLTVLLCQQTAAGPGAALGRVRLS